MSSYLFHRGDEAGALIAPPPSGYAGYTQRRALWQTLGLHEEDLTITEYEEAMAYMAAEAEDAKKRT